MYYINLEHYFSENFDVPKDKYNNISLRKIDKWLAKNFRFFRVSLKTGMYLIVH
jgi:hypothetical protein